MVSLNIRISIALSRFTWTPLKGMRNTHNDLIRTLNERMELRGLTNILSVCANLLNLSKSFQNFICWTLKLHLQLLEYNIGASCCFRHMILETSTS
jgi:hypothetical protein